MLTYLAKLAYLRNGIGPCSNAFSAVSEKVSDGTFAFRHTSCDVLTCELLYHRMFIRTSCRNELFPHKYTALRISE